MIATTILAEFRLDELQELREAMDHVYGRRPARAAITELRKKVHGLVQEAEFAEHQQMIADSQILRHRVDLRRAG